MYRGQRIRKNGNDGSDTNSGSGRNRGCNSATVQRRCGATAGVTAGGHAWAHLSRARRDAHGALAPRVLHPASGPLQQRLPQPGAARRLLLVAAATAAPAPTAALAVALRCAALAVVREAGPEGVIVQRGACTGGV
eukprot:365619-Chlamydomonas_euryale.AAC.22